MANKILVIEDEDGMRDILSTYLRKNEFEVYEADNGNSGLQIFKNNKIDMVLLDIILPDMSGLSVLRIIREKSKIPIMIITARSEEYDKLLGFDLGADDYVIKPFSPKEVIERIKAIFNRTKCDDKSDIIEFNGIMLNIS